MAMLNIQRVHISYITANFERFKHKEPLQFAGALTSPISRLGDLSRALMMLASSGRYERLICFPERLKIHM